MTKRGFAFAGLFGLMVALSGLTTPVAVAQSLAGRPPAWATPLLAADLDSFNGGRASLIDPAYPTILRLAIAPTEGGVARVVRIELPAPEREAESRLVLRRFTGHPRNGWFLWGPDQPISRVLTAGERAEVERLVRNATAPGVVSADSQASCPEGEAAFMELAAQGRVVAANRACVGPDAFGALARAVSRLAGSETEQALMEAATEELMAADRAFNTLAQEEGVPAAFAAFAHPDVVLFKPRTPPFVGAEGVAARFADWPAGGTLVWSPQEARVSARGDMGWTWGEGLYTPREGAPFRSLYVTVWQRDPAGRWRYVTDIGIEGPPRR